MKLGTVVKLLDGREGTVVYNGLDGVGIKFGVWPIGEEDRDLILSGGPFSYAAPNNYPWFPEAMLRESYPSADLPCVSEDYEIVSVPARGGTGGS